MARTKLKGPEKQLSHQKDLHLHRGPGHAGRWEGYLQKPSTTAKSAKRRKNGRESIVWVRRPGNQPWRGVLNNLAIARLRHPVSSDLKHSVLRFARSQVESSITSQTVWLVSGFRPQFPVYLPAHTPASPDSGS
jgi:hypothetical protein